MNVAVIIPVGPGHGEYAGSAAASVLVAWERDPGPFDAMRLDVVEDLDGTLGRSAARNLGMDRSPADWHFLLDADDRMLPDAFGLVDLTAPVTFGTIMLDGRLHTRDRYPVTHEAIREHGADGTLAMGCFVRGDLGVRFNETLHKGEDFDFYMRLPGFTKLRVPLVNIGYRTPSALDPRGTPGEWLEACRTVVDFYARAASG